MKKLKKVFLVSVAIMTSVSMFAQSESSKAVIGISPVQLMHGVRIKYEKPLSDKISYGALLTGYYGDFPGGQLAPIVRYYFKKHAPEGFYAQAKIVFGMHLNDYATYKLKDGETAPIYLAGVMMNGDPVTKTQTFFNVGGGLTAGYQMLFGKDDKWSIDVNFGVKFVGGVPVPDDAAGGVLDNLGWAVSGPGSIIDGLFSVGYRF
ncbi:hypothetical protein AGMMS49982_08920 [Bacteroidia bacterium]|nr:hypothetical protein AGMMS49982_08920 [Bacteroidia bacterium]